MCHYSRENLDICVNDHLSCHLRLSKNVNFVCKHYIYLYLLLYSRILVKCKLTQGCILGIPVWLLESEMYGTI